MSVCSRKYRTTRSRSSVTSCGSGGGRFAPGAPDPLDGLVGLEAPGAAGAGLAGGGVEEGGVGSAGVVGSIEVRTLLRRGHESVEWWRIGIATDDVTDVHADGLALHLAELPVVDEREPDPAAEVHHTGQSGHAVERTRLAPEVPGQR